MASFIIATVESIEALRDRREEIIDHFHGSTVMQEHYENGCIDWDGNPINEDGSPFVEDDEWYYLP